MFRIADSERYVVYRNTHGFFGYNGRGTVCRDEEGVLYADCSGLRAAPICAFGKFPNIGERALISYDNGETWTDDYLLTHQTVSDLGYPSTVELDDGSLVTCYYERVGDDPRPSFLCTKWRPDKWTEGDAEADDWRKALVKQG